MESPQAGLSGTALASYEQTLDGLGCAIAKSPIQCLRSVPGADLKTHLTQRNISFPPVVDRITQTTDVRPNIISKQFANIPLIIGSNVDEARAFAAIAGIDNGKKTAEQFVSSIVPNMPLVQQAVIAAYSSLSNDVFLLASAILTDDLFTCTAGRLPSFAAQHGYKVSRLLQRLLPEHRLFPEGRRVPFLGDSAGLWHLSSYKSTRCCDGTAGAIESLYAEDLGGLCEESGSGSGMAQTGKQPGFRVGGFVILDMQGY